MLVFATSDKGGTGRSVTSCNLAYRTALQGRDACYLDFDFGSPTAGSIFSIPSVLRGTQAGGLHAHLRGAVSRTQSLDVWTESDRAGMRGRPDGAGQLRLFPGDEGGGEFSADQEVVQRCVRLLLRLEEEFDLVLVDLSAGRSHALDVVLAATAADPLRKITTRWLIYHRWTRQHIIAASGLVRGSNGILDIGVDRGHDRTTLARSIRFVRTAVVDPASAELSGLRAEQIAWLHDCNMVLQGLAGQMHVGRVSMLGEVPLDPVLQWREQLITDHDTMISQIANQTTADAFDLLAKRLTEESAWEGL